MGVAGPRLREARLRRGLSLSDVAQAAGVTKGFLSLAERAKTQISVPTLLRICDALDIKLGSLFDYPSETVVGVGAVEVAVVHVDEDARGEQPEDRALVEATLLRDENPKARQLQDFCLGTEGRRPPDVPRGGRGEGAGGLAV